MATTTIDLTIAYSLEIEIAVTKCINLANVNDVERNAPLKDEQWL